MNKNIFKINLLLLSLLSLVVFTSCEEDNVVPEEEHEEEIITDVKLVFTPTNTLSGLASVEATAQDPDGEGVQELQVLGSIDLAVNASYTLTYEIMNNEESPGEDIGEEISEEADEHQIFYSFTDGAFTSPTGNGNIDNASDPVNYNDSDSNGNPIGLSTAWTTGSSLSSGSFTVRLQHQPDVKTSTSTANTGDTDFELTFVLNIQ
ncbi:MAG: GTP cyclohydrolase [Bacteroidota bacterium]|nr:GTP cyclohydrolase [Bacteroidota bacterium]